MIKQIMKLFGKERLAKLAEFYPDPLEQQDFVMSMYLGYFEGQLMEIYECVKKLPSMQRQWLNEMLRHQARVAGQMQTEQDPWAYQMLSMVYTDWTEQIRKLEKRINPPKYKSTLDVEAARASPIGDFLPDNTRTYDSTERATYKCPFHNEKTGSMVWYKKNNTFFCFGCNAGGDSIKFIMDYYKMDFVQAVKKLTS